LLEGYGKLLDYSNVTTFFMGRKYNLNVISDIFLSTMVGASVYLPLEGQD
jgi:hypothetical protein